MSDVVLGSMGPKEYLEGRVKQYQNWYDAKSVKMKSRYLLIQTLSVVGSAIVPVLVNLTIPFGTYITTIISLMVVVLISIESVHHYREQWKNYRSTEQFLGRETHLYLTREGPYLNLKEDTAFPLLVDRIEKAIANENSATLNIMTYTHSETHSDQSKK